jgi:hypothetical protein
MAWYLWIRETGLSVKLEPDIAIVIVYTLVYDSKVANTLASCPKAYKS